MDGIDDVPRNLKTDESGGETILKQQQEKREEDPDEEETCDGERDDSSPISNKRGRIQDEGCNDDTSSSKNNNNISSNDEEEDEGEEEEESDAKKEKKNEQRTSNGSGEEVAEKETGKNSFAMIVDESVPAAGSTGPSRPSLCSSSSETDSQRRQDRHHVNGRKRSSNSTGEEDEESESEDDDEDGDDDDDAAAAAAAEPLPPPPSVFHNNEARDGKNDSALHRLHSQIAFSSSSSGGAGETAAKAGMDGHHHHEEKSCDNSSSSHHLMQPSPKKKFKDDLTGEWVCPVCSKKLDSQHTFTVHIRQHNPTDHSHTCSICNKTLSSASSLDRHMLIHSGERPFRCRICNMAFTTNGNMHRHMRTHGSNDLLSDRSGRKSKPLRDTGKLAEKRSLPDDGDSEQSNESALIESPLSRDLSPSSVSDLSAIGRSAAAGDAATNPRFANTVKTLMNGKFPFPGLGFFDLSFTDFSSQKFPSIAQNFCEHNFRKSTSPFHEFECGKCLRGFPASSALSLHDAVHSATFCGFCRIDLGSPDAFLKHVIQHRIEGLGLSPDEVSGFLRSNPFSQVNEKEGFMAMLQLHNREADRLAAQSASEVRNKSLSARLEDDGFDSAAYFVHGKPAARSASVPDAKSTPVDRHQEEQQSGTTSQHSNEGSNSFDSEAGKHDLADIQSIISVTNSGNHLKQIPAASPSLPSGTEDEECDVRKAACDSATDAAASTRITAESKSGDAGNQQEERPASESSSAVSLTCRICAIQFKNPAALKKHARSHTQGSHNYSCHLCPYTSLDKSTLVRHLRTHNGERPFQCSICKYAFTTKANCERHVRKRHKKFSKQEIKQLMQYNSDLLSSHNDPPIIRKVNSDSSSFKSLYGSESSGRKSFTNKHLMNGDDDSLDSQDLTDTSCNDCGLNFDSNISMQKHLRSGNCSLNPFVCAVCQSGFRNKNLCLKHIRERHAGVEEKAILFRGESIAVSSCSSDFSDEESGAISMNGSVHSPSPRIASSSHHPVSPSSMNLSHGTGSVKHIDTHAKQSHHHHLLHPHEKLAHEKNHSDRNSSLAALCHVANISSPSSKPLNLTSKPDTDDYDAGDEFDENNNNDEQPFDLSRRSNRDPHFQPLDLALHALDLSVKASNKAKQSPSAVSVPLMDAHLSAAAADLSARKAADILLTLQSVAARNPFPPHPSLFLSPAQQASAMAAALNQSSLLFPSTQQQLLHLQQGLHQAAAASVVANSSSSKTSSSSPSCVMSAAGAKNERCFTCKICSAGFTLKSNMERHIKRKHVLK